MGTRRFVLQRRFVDFGRINSVRHDTDPRKQFKAARRGRGEDQFHIGKALGTPRGRITRVRTGPDRPVPA